MNPRLARITGLLALALLLYLPVEPAFLASLPAGLYWFLRLAPDALIVLLAASLVVSEARAPSLQTRLLLVLAALAVTLIAFDAARGFAAVDTVNALRVVLRYVVLGLVLWRAAPYILRFPEQFQRAILAAGLIQIGAAIVEIALRFANPASLNLNGLWFIEGTTGRYDRFGFSMVLFVVVVFVRLRRRLDRNSMLLGAAGSLGVFLLVLTASRQAILALAVAALAITLARVSWRNRAGLLAASAALVFMTALVPSTLRIAQVAPGVTNPGGPDELDRGGSGTVIITTEKGSTEISINPNRNFRLYLNAVLTPWAALQEPLIGFGPMQHIDVYADTRLRNAVASAGMDWAYATTFTNDSNYASLVIQFGLLLPVLFIAALGYLALSALRRTRARGQDSIAPIAFAVAAAFAVTAVFGPIFEQRTSSSALWISLFTAFAFRTEGS